MRLVGALGRLLGNTVRQFRCLERNSVVSKAFRYLDRLGHAVSASAFPAEVEEEDSENVFARFAPVETVQKLPPGCPVDSLPLEALGYGCTWGHGFPRAHQPTQFCYCEGMRACKT